MGACGHFLADIAPFFKINGCQLVQPGFQHQGAVWGKVCCPFWNPAANAPFLPFCIRLAAGHILLIYQAQPAQIGVALIYCADRFFGQCAGLYLV